MSHKGAKVQGRCRLTHDHHLRHDSLTSLFLSSLHPPPLVHVGQGSATSPSCAAKFSPWISRSLGGVVFILSTSQRVLGLANRSDPTHRPPQSPQRSRCERSRRKTVREWPRWHSNGPRDAAHRALGAQGQASRCWVDAAG
ncbi:hypothetical protein C8Q80DRAFT_470579 [Daedaleopsis nitida]|nr:hypothetical protein C8Q80DRAFT_470579 [Daedaleopsis nitida]